VHFTEWNSSLLVRRSMKRGKKKDLLTPTTFSLLHAVDFADRLTYQIVPPLKAGMIVLADRYVYTAFARDVARGVHPGLGARGLRLRAAPGPDVLLPRPDRGVAAAPPHRTDEAQVPRGRHGRRARHRPRRQLPPLPEPRPRQLRQGHGEFGLRVIDAAADIPSQQKTVRREVERMLQGYDGPRTESS
jgi:dTMP kinase